jgi:glutathione S-transferase
MWPTIVRVRGLPRAAARYRLQLWLNFITSELHKLVLRPRVARAFAEEMTLYTEEQARRAAAAA